MAGSLPGVSFADQAGGESVRPVEDVVVVTGSRIKRAETAQPTIELSGDDIDARGFTNVADALNEIPQFSPGVSTTGTTGTTSSGTNGGKQFVNFFGLGTQRTLTLINGRRVVSGNSLNNTGSAGVQVDLSIIPTALIERIDTVSVGGAPIYGSDAVAGVVNVIMKDNFEGFEVDGLYGITQEGDGQEYRVRGVWGGNFADDRGNAVLSLEYNQSDSLNQFDRPDIFVGPGYLSNTNGRVLPSGITPSQILTTDERVHVATEGGIPLLGDGTTNNAATHGVPLPGMPGVIATQFAPNGDLVPYNPGGTEEVVFGEGGDGLYLPSWVDLRQETERLIATGMFKYDVKPGLTAFAETLFANTDAIDPRNSPFINSNLFPGGGRDVIGVPLTNPFLTPQARGVLTSALDTNMDSVADVNIIDTDGDGVADTPGFFLSQFTDDYQNGAPSFNQSTTYRIVVGVEGDFEAIGRNFNYDLSYNYGRTDSSFREADRHSARFFNAVNSVALTDGDIMAGIPDGIAAVRNGAVVSIGPSTAQAGDIICAGFLNPPPDPATPVDLNSPNSNLNGCVPLNPFGGGGITQEALDFFIIDQTSESKLTQQVISFNLSGELFDLPAGPFAFAVGWEHRKESGVYEPGEFLRLGLGDAPAETSVEGDFSTQEGMLEIAAPVLDPDFASFGPFQLRLDLEGAARIVANTTAARQVTYTAGGRFSPHPDVLFRGNFTRSIRAPAITELFLPIQTVDSFAQDPCDIDNINRGPNPSARAANCITAVIANGNAANAADAQAFLASHQSIIDNALQPITTGGNPNLNNEIAKSWTVGTTLTPSFIPGLTVTADWVDIFIENAIFNVNGTSLLSACFDSSTYPVDVCDSVFRGPGFQVNNLITGFANIGFIEFRSLSGSINYSRDLADLPFFSSPDAGRLHFTLNAQHIDTFNISVLGTGDDLNIQADEPSNPGFSFLANIAYTNGPLQVFWKTQFQGETDINRNDGDFLTLEVPFIEAHKRFDLGASYQISENFRVRALINNITNSKPSFVARAAGQSNLFDPIGRRFQIGVTATF